MPASVFKNPKRYDSDDETVGLLSTVPPENTPLSFSRKILPLPNSLGGYTAYPTSNQSD
jgi:hypothetical protein